MKNIIALLILSSSFSFTDALSGDLPDYISMCADCHGNKGVSSESDIPTIAGASDVFISDTMLAYQDGSRIAIESKYRHGDTARAATDMKKISKDLTEEQIEEIATYFSEQAFVAAKQEFDDSLVSKGKKTHESRCKKCHEDGGSSADDDSGILAGQWTPYLREAFKLYRNGERAMDEKMKKKMDKLSDKQVEALLNYYASQQ